MTQYTPSQDDIKKAKEIFDKIIMTQTLNPIKIKEAYKLLFGLDATNTQLARMKVHAYFTYTFKGFDKTETAIPEESTSLSTETSTPQRHSEDEVVEGIVIPEGSFEKECHSESNTPNSVLVDDDDTMAQQFIEDVKASLDTINEMNEIEKELENSQLSDNHQSENSDNGDNQVVETNLKLVAKPKRTRKQNKKK